MSKYKVGDILVREPNELINSQIIKIVKIDEKGYHLFYSYSGMTCIGSFSWLDRVSHYKLASPMEILLYEKIPLPEI